VTIYMQAVTPVYYRYVKSKRLNINIFHRLYTRVTGPRSIKRQVYLF